jgi:hypothetical protein
LPVVQTDFSALNQRAGGVWNMSMANSAKEIISAVVSAVTARALLNSTRAGRGLVAAVELIAISLVVTKDSS